MPFTKFEYLYRDSDNYKAFGSVIFEGTLSDTQWTSVRKCFVEETLFIAEQIGLPSLQAQLWRWGNGQPTNADHCWHEFSSCSILDSLAGLNDIPNYGPIDELVERIISLRLWDILSQSPFQLRELPA